MFGIVAGVHCDAGHWQRVSTSQSHFRRSHLSPSASPGFKSRLDVFLSPLFKFPRMTQLESANSPISHVTMLTPGSLRCGSGFLHCILSFLATSLLYLTISVAANPLLPRILLSAPTHGHDGSTLSRDGIGPASYSQAQFLSSLISYIHYLRPYCNSPFLITLF
jgi:hypothetical protein